MLLPFVCANFSYCNNVYMCAFAEAYVTFRFVYTPEYLLPGSTFLFREGKAKGVRLEHELLQC